jgi:nitroimidazol reductase NimA-like FMN-containing flavoprotein (pyridoxamine 5'-phosphate oxidase superfamily)
MIREMSRQECDMLLAQNRIGRMGFRDGDAISILPISYAFHEGVLYAHCAPGHKLDCLREDPTVGFEVDEIRNIQTWRSVLIHGRCEVLTQQTDLVQARMQLLRAFEGSHMNATAGHGHRTTLAEATLLRIHIDSITGRAEHM